RPQADGHPRCGLRPGAGCGLRLDVGLRPGCRRRLLSGGHVRYPASRAKDSTASRPTPSRPHVAVPEGGVMSALLMLTSALQPSVEVLPALSLLPHTVRVLPAEGSALLEAPPADLILVDGRQDLA